MRSFQELYQKLLQDSLGKDRKDEKDYSDFDASQLDCLLHPDRHPATVWRIGECACCEDDKSGCESHCAYNAIKRDQDGNVVIDDKNCVGCADCIDKCPRHNLVSRKDIFPLLELLDAGEAPVYAMIAPAFIRQFSHKVTPGKLRTAFKKMGFAGMIEVALFADVLTLKEAFEFDRNIHEDKDYLLTSCCCPIWIAMIRKSYDQLVPHMPPSVSPMVACGRSIKQISPEAKTVFIGPCVAKKAEAKEPDIKDAVDFVLTFQEIWDVLLAAGINPEECDEDLRDHSSAAGRMYARVGGVSEAVQNTVNRINPNRTIPLRAAQANGAVACKALLKDVLAGEITANFIEGMGCVGGCVGGPRILVDKEQGTKFVNEYGEEATYKTPMDNPYVIELLHRLGFDTVEELLEGDNLFIRHF